MFDEVKEKAGRLFGGGLTCHLREVSLLGKVQSIKVRTDLALRRQFQAGESWAALQNAPNAPLPAPSLASLAQARPRSGLPQSIWKRVDQSCSVPQGHAWLASTCVCCWAVPISMPKRKAASCHLQTELASCQQSFASWQRTYLWLVTASAQSIIAWGFLFRFSRCSHI